MGLPRASRLNRREDYERLYRDGRKYVHPLAVFFVLRSDGAAPRVGLTASRRIGNAVVRNHVKRRMREVWRKSMPELPPVDIVMVARSGLARATFAEHEEAVSRFLCWLKPKRW